VTGVSSLYYYVFVSFTVTNSATGKPVSATVVGVLTVPSGQQYSGSLTTGSNGKGEFEIEALSGAGTYSFTMTASAKGYTSGSATVTFYVAGTAKHSQGIQSGVFAQ